MTARSLIMDAHGLRAWQGPDESPETGTMPLPVTDAAGFDSSQNTSPARELQQQLRVRVEHDATIPAGKLRTPGQKLAIIACAATASWLLVAAIGSAVYAIAIQVS